MILPTKYVGTSQSILGLGALLLSNMEKAQPVSALWEKVRDNPDVGTFERFTLALDLLYVVDVVDFERDLLIRKIR